MQQVGRIFELCPVFNSPVKEEQDLHQDQILRYDQYQSTLRKLETLGIQKYDIHSQGIRVERY